MQLTKPFRVVDVGLPAWDVLRVVRVDQDHLKPVLLQYLESRYPVDPCRLHRHARDATGSKPGGEIMQVLGEGAEGADWHAVTVRIDGRHMHRGPDVDGGRTGINRGEVLRGGLSFLGGFSSFGSGGAGPGKFVIFLTGITAEAASPFLISQQPMCHAF